MSDREYIARISYGKDSLKMLEVIHSRGLPLDRITTTDVWATDTISANLPPMDEFKHRMDERIWQLYHIDIEHLCAMNKDGSKRTYEQMFYHVPVRRSQIGQVERETDSGPARSSASRTCGGRGVRLDSSGIPAYRAQGSIKGFPGTIGVKWCQKLKIYWTGNQRFPIVTTRERGQVVSGSQDTIEIPLRGAPHEAQGHKYRGIPWDSSR